MRIRPARADEADAVLTALGWLFAPPGGPPPDWSTERARTTFDETFDDPATEVFLAEVEDGAVVGVCTVALDLRSIRYGQRAWVEDLAVDPERRSGGVGKALLDAAKAWARERGATHLELDSGDARTDAHRFYDREQPTSTGRSYGWTL